ncbi:hypothetical protein [Azonexus fungiphilus]|uniref:hypothetical protein n=1 Tax=Azonexus fungiphilus TaxID=146940 RepID=UPI00156AA20E|nr:hypothetical protein [Azonexus fungiphilus]NHC06970.1 hypothetical protein [Azonexus fungiphilus]
MNAPTQADVFPTDFLAEAGLNRQHVFACADLPAALLAPLARQPRERQLILLGHAGRRLWQCVQAARPAGEHPIDDYTKSTVDRCFARFFPGRHYRIVYPGPAPIGLQALGAHAGWHQPSPLMIGIDREWGSWYAYRCVILADTGFSPDATVDRENPAKSSPCTDCRERPCVAACPAGAVGDRFDLAACSDERLRPGSPCGESCLARLACPVGSEHRYDATQIRHSYRQSLALLKSWRLSRRSV